MKLKPIPLLVLLVSVFLSVIITGCSSGTVVSEAQLQPVTVKMQQQLQARLSDLDNTLAAAALKIAKSGLTGDETRQVLEDMCSQCPYLVDCAAADNSGTMLTLAPESCRQYEGISTSKNEVSTEFAANKEPLLSNMFQAVQGFDAIVLVRPVVSEQGKLMGSVSALFKPEELLSGIIAPMAKEAEIKVNVVQLDGLAIYCTTGTETGKNVLTDASYKEYPELVKQAGRMLAEQTGIAHYTFPSVKIGQPVKKTMCWNSVGLHGNEWRIVAIAEFDN